MAMFTQYRIALFTYPLFYLAYLRGRRFPPRIPSPPLSPPLPPSPRPQIYCLSLQYISSYIGKIIETRRGQCTWNKYSLSKDTIWQGTWSRLKNKIKNHCNIIFLKIVSQNAPDCILAHIHFKKIPGGMPPDPPRMLAAFGHSGLLPKR